MQITRYNNFDQPHRKNHTNATKYLEQVLLIVGYGQAIHRIQTCTPECIRAVTTVQSLPNQPARCFGYPCAPCGLSLPQSLAQSCHLDIR